MLRFPVVLCGCALSRPATVLLAVAVLLPVVAACQTKGTHPDPDVRINALHKVENRLAPNYTTQP